MSMWVATRETPHYPVAFKIRAQEAQALPAVAPMLEPEHPERTAAGLLTAGEAQVNVLDHVPARLGERSTLPAMHIRKESPQRSLAF